MSKKETLLPFIEGFPQAEEPVVIVDSNEATTARRIVKGLKDAGASVRILPLEKGDYIVSDVCVLERKTVSDFVQTLTQGRLFEQLTALKEAYEHPLLVLEGELQSIFEFRGVRPRAIWGALFFLARNGIPIVPTADWMGTVDLIYTAARQEQLVEKRKAAVRPLKRIKTLEEAQLYLMCGIPLIGGEKAKALLGRFESPLNAFIHIEEWDDVKGIGKKIKGQAKKVLATPFPLESS